MHGKCNFNDQRTNRNFCGEKKNLQNRAKTIRIEWKKIGIVRTKRGSHRKKGFTIQRKSPLHWSDFGIKKKNQNFANEILELSEKPKLSLGKCCEMLEWLECVCIKKGNVERICLLVPRIMARCTWLHFCWALFFALSSDLRVCVCARMLTIRLMAHHNYEIRLAIIDREQPIKSYAAHHKFSLTLLFQSISRIKTVFANLNEGFSATILLIIVIHKTHSHLHAYHNCVCNVE